MKIKKLILTSAVAGMVLVSVTTVALAASIVQNGSFESGTDSIGEYKRVPDEATIDNWEVVSGNVEIIGTYWPASEGSRSIDLSGLVAGSIRQPFPTEAGKNYIVKFDMAGNPEGGSGIKTLTADVGGDPISPFSFDTTNHTKNTKETMGWETRNFEFTATAGTTVLTFTSNVDSAYGPALDNVIVEEIVSLPPQTVMPADKEECKKDGWDEFGVFNNQGDCVSYVETDGQNEPANQ